MLIIVIYHHVPFNHYLEIEMLKEAIIPYGDTTHPSSTGFEPQLATILYDISQNVDFMKPYFPVLSEPNPQQTETFFQEVQFVMKHPNLQLSILGTSGENITKSSPPSIRLLVAGHIAEVLFKRPELLRRFLEKPRLINIYMSAWAYTRAGGVSGGCYDPATQSIKLVASRLYEGFYNPKPGVVPFIHEFGHMLDYFDVGSSEMRSATGLLPGMQRIDFDFFSLEARELFIAGKNLELERYENVRLRQANQDTDLPIGGPYVFQNDGEFIAGYLEMFFRNPHYFYELNPTLYKAFELTWYQDPRNYWQNDFDFYIKQNRAIYLNNSQQIPKPGLQIFS